jgi:hypothetical protein
MSLKKGEGIHFILHQGIIYRSLSMPIVSRIDWDYNDSKNMSILKLSNKSLINYYLSKFLNEC